MYDSSEAILNQQRQVAAVVQVRVGQGYSFDRVGLEWELGIAFEGLAPMSLKHSAVEEVSVFAG